MSDSEQWPEFKPAGRQSPTQYVQQQLLAAIRNGELGPDKPFPSANQLCEAFGVSRVSVREALVGLVATGLLEIRQGKRPVVRRPMDDVYMGLFALYLDWNKNELQQLLEVRGALDGFAASLFVARADDGDLAAVTTAEAAFARAVDEDASPETLKERDVAFHRAIAAGAHNPLLASMLDGIGESLVNSREILFADRSVLARSVAAHAGIVAALSARDGNLAGTRATEHVTEAWQHFQQLRGYDPGSDTER